MKAGSDKVIMLIDDNEIDNYINKKFIEDKQIAREILVKTTVWDAIKYFESEKDNNKLPELILLDMNLPALNGYDFLNRFYDLNLVGKKKSRIAILSSSDGDEDIMRVKNHPLVVNYFIKPLSPEALDTIKTLLDYEEKYPIS
jgi:CheY-like chemotaxis protein